MTLNGREFAIVAIACTALLLTLSPSARAFDKTELKCRDSIARNGLKLASTVTKLLSGCHKKRSAGKLPGATNCNVINEADSKGKATKVENKLRDQAVARCGGILPSNIGYSACPFPCDSAVPAINDFQDVGQCLICLVEDSLTVMSASAQGNPAVPMEKGAQKCHAMIGKNQRKHLRTIIKGRRGCQKQAEAGGATDTSSCSGVDPRGKIGKARDKGNAALAKSCGGVDLLNVDSCADTDVAALQVCVFDDSDIRGEELFQNLYGLAGGGGPTTTTTMGGAVQDPQCPDQGEVILFAGVGRTCTTSAECPVGSCDPLLGRCVTPTELDTGQTGIAHDADTNDEILTRGRLLCPGPASPTCGQCEVLGIDPAPGNCRCENDNRQICDQPFQADATNCGGAVCNCYFGPPFPLSSGNTPACVVNRFAQDISGTGNVDTGDGQIDANLRSQVFLGLTLIEPCPFCTGDVTANDGLREGICVDGPNDGQSCDENAVNTSFPAPGGDGYSLDCFPDIGKNVSGQGLQINLSQTTGSVSMSSNLACGFPFLGSSCPCRQCSGDPTVPCNSDAECAAAGLGSCDSLGSGVNAGPNGCSLGVCNDIGGGEGECNSGPDNTFCDGVVRSNGEGFIGCSTQRKCSLAPNPQCTTNADCTGGTDTCEFLDCKPGAIGIDAGDCLLTKRQECFLDPIVATGTPDPNAPVGVAVFCIPPTGNAGINGVAGLPGAGRVKNQATARTFCASDPTVQYQPGVGGCP